MPAAIKARAHVQLRGRADWRVIQSADDGAPTEIAANLLDLTTGEPVLSLVTRDAAVIRLLVDADGDPVDLVFQRGM